MGKRALMNDSLTMDFLARQEVPAKFNTSEWQFDYTYLPVDYLRVLLAAGRALGVFDSSKTSIKALTVGLGGGCVNTFLRYTTENVNVTAVEIDASMVEVAKKFFGFIEDERQHCVVDDGVHFLGECVRKG
ncbi:unnamed protein product [Toxocara canis]|uniref:Methyltransferase-like protein 13 n=1 Tax=Toxocara canis TaxID=6265 RepID=A0A183V1Z6_TOXCA|nr:unnamed protein product [Toxocara canis]